MLLPRNAAIASLTLIAAVVCCWSGRSDAHEFVLVRDGRPAATIVTAAAASDVAAFSAQELRYHVQKITGAVLPIRSDAEKVDGARILVGPSAATAALGVQPSDLKEQEYVIRFVDNTLILLGKRCTESGEGSQELAGAVRRGVRSASADVRRTSDVLCHT